jgi:hypothetical protein
LLREQVESNGDGEALVSAWQEIRWTYRQLDELSDEVARGFWGLGVRKGDRMAIMAGNCAEYVLVRVVAQGILTVRRFLRWPRLGLCLRLLIRPTKKRNSNLHCEQLVGLFSLRANS